MNARVLRQHYDELYEILSSSPSMLESLANKFYQAGYFNLADFECTDARVGARVLLDCLVLKVEQSSEHLQSILSIMGLESSELTQKIQSSRVNHTPRPVIGLNAQLITTSSHCHVIANQPPVADTIAEAEKLHSSFISLADMCKVDIAINYVNLVKMKIRALVQFHYISFPEIQFDEILANLPSIASMDEAIQFMINQDLLGYLNFMMLKYVLRSIFVLSSPNLVEMIDCFEKQHNHFIHHNPLKNIAVLLEQRPDLAPLCCTGLPEVRFTLSDSWKDRCLHQWNEMLQDVGILPDHLMIKCIKNSIDSGSVSINYAIIPFFMSAITETLRNTAVVEVFARCSAVLEVKEEVIKAGSIEKSNIDLGIKHADNMLKNRLFKPFTRTSCQPLTVSGYMDKTNETSVVPQPAPGPPEAGYDDEIFLSPPKDLQCIICLLTVREPHLITCCGAILCEICMLHIDASTECPLCRNKNHLVVVDKRTKGQMMSLKVKCTSGDGCDWRGELVDYTSHITKKCPNRVVKCQYGCGLFYKVVDIAVHEEEECTRRPRDVIIAYYERRIKSLVAELQQVKEEKRILEQSNLHLMSLRQGSEPSLSNNSLPQNEASSPQRESGQTTDVAHPSVTLPQNKESSARIDTETDITHPNVETSVHNSLPQNETLSQQISSEIDASTDPHPSINSSSSLQREVLQQQNLLKESKSDATADTHPSAGSSSPPQRKASSQPTTSNSGAQAAPATSSGRNTQEYEALRRFSAEISSRIHCRELSQQLFAIGFIGPDQHFSEDESSSAMTRRLMKSVFAKLEEDSENLYKFIEILEKDSSLKELCSRILEQCEKGKPSSVFSTMSSSIISTMSSMGATPSLSHLHSYSGHLRSFYGRRQRSANKWPAPAIHAPIIDLAVVMNEPVTSWRSADEITRLTLRGQVDDIRCRKERIELENIFDCSDGAPAKCVFVEGAPGIGKSTFVWELCLKWATDKLQRFSLVVFACLREKRLQQARFLIDILPVLEGTNVETVLQEIRSTRGESILWILDGFDELPSCQRKSGSIFIKLIKGEILPESAVLVTSRPSVTAAFLEQCSEYISQRIEIIGFTDDQLKQYIQSRFKGRKKLLESFQYERNAKFTGMMRIPLNAAIVCSVHEDKHREGNIASMTDLYNSLVLVTLRRHMQHVKGVSFPPRLMCYSDIRALPRSIQNKFKRILKIARDGLLSKEYTFTNLEGDFDGLGLMHAVSSLNITSGQELSHHFFHLSLQEYLATIYHIMRGEKFEVLVDAAPSTAKFYFGIAKRVARFSIPAAVQVLKMEADDHDSLWDSMFDECLYEYSEILTQVFPDGQFRYQQ